MSGPMQGVQVVRLTIYLLNLKCGMKTKERCLTSNPTNQGRSRPKKYGVVPVVIKTRNLGGLLD